MVVNQKDFFLLLLDEDFLLGIHSIKNDLFYFINEEKLSQTYRKLIQKKPRASKIFLLLKKMCAFQFWSLTKKLLTQIIRVYEKYPAQDFVLVDLFDRGAYTAHYRTSSSRFDRHNNISFGSDHGIVLADQGNYYDHPDIPQKRKRLGPSLIRRIAWYPFRHSRTPVPDLFNIYTPGVLGRIYRNYRNHSGDHFNSSGLNK